MSNTSRQVELRAKLERAALHDRRVLDAVEATPRDLFVPEELEARAYDDSALPIGLGQTISQPYMVALMTQELALAGDELVLEIGTGSGYQAAILSKLCCELVTVERLPELAVKAQRVLSKIGCANIEFSIGDGTLGWPARAPFDGIIVTAAAPKIPVPLLNQLKPGGRLVIPIGEDDIQTLVVVTRQECEPVVRNVCGCRFVKLIGEAGWPPE